MNDRLDICLICGKDNPLADFSPYCGACLAQHWDLKQKERQAKAAKA